MPDDFLDLDKFFDEHIKSCSEVKSDKLIWLEEPVTFREFLSSRDHMAFPDYSERQYMIPDYLFGDNPKGMFENGKYMAVVEAGKGSGKDTISAHCITYAIYILLCCKNPRIMFPGIGPTDPIDCVNVAYNDKQSLIVFFEKFKTGIINWKWLKRKYNFKASGKLLNPSETLLEEEKVIINQNSIFFPNKIRVFSMNSQQEGWEGLNPLLWVLDEFAAFLSSNKTRNSDTILSVAETSAQSRYGQKYKGFVISYPRYKDDAIQKLRKQYEGSLNVYTDRATTFEMKPNKCFSGKWCDYKGYKIPLEYKERFEKKPEDSETKYLCLPQHADDPFFKEPARIDACTDTRNSIIEVEDYTKTENGKNYICKRIKKVNFGVTENLYCIIIDLGLSFDPSAVAVWHKERYHLPDQAFEDHFYQDFVSLWQPDESKKLVVNLDDVENFVKDLIKIYKLPVFMVLCDRWNSANMMQHFNANGIKNEHYIISPQDYNNCRASLYSGSIHLLDYAPQTNELKRLVNDGRGGANHLPDEHNDLSQTTFAAIKLLTSENIGSKKNTGMKMTGDSGEIVDSNINNDGIIIGDMGSNFTGEGVSFRH